MHRQRFIDNLKRGVDVGWTKRQRLANMMYLMEGVVMFRIMGTSGGEICEKRKEREKRGGAHDEVSLKCWQRTRRVDR